MLKTNENMMGKTLRKFLKGTSADDINAIESNIDNPSIKVFDVVGTNEFKCKDILRDRENATCDEVCLQLSEKLDLGFITSQLLGLQVKDKRNGVKWLSAKDPVTATSGEEIYLRLRHIPTQRGCSRLKDMDNKGLEYVYFQVAHDFLHETLPLKDNIEKSDGLGTVTLSLLIKLRLETEQRQSATEDLNHFLETTNVASFVPKCFKNDNVIDNYTLKKSIWTKMKNLHEKYPASKQSSKDLMKSYLEHILGKEVLKPHFYEESFEAKRLLPNSERGDVTILTDKGAAMPQVKLMGKELGTEHFKCWIKDLSSLEVNQRSVANETFYEVQIARVNGIPEIVYFESESDAKSFVTCLESFSRLTADYYSSLCPSLAPEWFREMSHARVHGPSSLKYLERILQVKYDCRPERYILCKSTVAYNEYYLISFNNRQKLQMRQVGEVVHTERGYQLKGEDVEPVRDLKTLLRQTVIRKNLATTSSIPVRPQAEVCDILYQLLQDKPVPRLVEEDEIEEQDRRKLEQQPKVYLPRDLDIIEAVGKGYFTEVSKAILCEEESVIVKSLRQSEIPSEFQHTCFKSLQDAMTRQMTLDNPAYFVGYAGICLDTPTKMILKDTDYGCLKDFLRFRDSTTTLNQQHLNEATLNIANALLFMEERKLYHGNLNCSNILVAKYDASTLIVKITDPGLITLYNQMPLDSEVNRKRVPWLSPKLFPNWSDTSKQIEFSIQTDVYAFGTTIWEMFNNGWGPLDVGQQLNGWKHENVIEFFKSGKHVDRPVYLEVINSDPKGVKDMKEKMYEKILQKCWELEEEEMLLPNRIVKDINQSFGNYGKYHEYNLVDYYAISPSGSQPLENTSGTSGLESMHYQHQDKKVPDLSCLVTAGRSVQPTTTDHEQTVPKTVADEDPDQTKVKTLAREPALVPSNVDIEQTIPKTVLKESPKRTHVKATVGEPTHKPLPQSLLTTRAAAASGSRLVPVSELHSGQPASRALVVKNVNYMIKEERLKLDKSFVLGKGHYGFVFKGELAPLSSAGHKMPLPVAVKQLKEEMLDRYAEDFRKEIAVMETLQNENIVKFHGVCRGEQYIVMEYLDGGSLYTYVFKKFHQENTLIPQSQFLKISLDVAKGMEYLWSKKVLHMDLACRNVLLTRDMCAKVSDFGLSKLLAQTDKDYYRRSPGVAKTIPMLWCAIEWLGQIRFTTKCDIWSFGVTMWEMCSYGKKPNICKDETEFQKEGHQRLKNGERLPQPKNCSPELYQLMLDCWKENPDNRPEFSECVSRLHQLNSGNTSEPQNQKQNGGACGDGRPDNKQGRLQKKDSQNSEASESSDEDYHKMTAAGVGNNCDNTQQASNVSQQTTNTVKEISAQGQQTRALPPKPAEPQEVESQKETSKSKTEQTTLSNISGKTSNQRSGFEYEPNQSKHFINESDVMVTEVCLGKGSFGKVMKGILEEKEDKKVEVAVKLFESAENLHDRFKREFQILGTISHPNIVQFKGIIKGGERIERYVMELMSNGDLSTYIKNNGDSLHERNKEKSLDMRLGFLLDVAEGMSYLSEKSILHCDLTAANILLSHDLVAKISDFGLSKRLDKTKDETGIGHYKRTNAKFKLLWSAPEVIGKEVYTRTSDVWSYGVLCMEVFLNDKELVFNGKDHSYWNKNIDQYIRCINQGYRFERPEICSEGVYEVMKFCWSPFPEKRLKFQGIVDKIRQLKENLKN